MRGVRDRFSPFKSMLYFYNKEKLYWWVCQIFCVLKPCSVMVLPNERLSYPSCNWKLTSLGPAMPFLVSFIIN